MSFTVHFPATPFRLILMSGAYIAVIWRDLSSDSGAQQSRRLTPIIWGRKQIKFLVFKISNYGQSPETH
jgi:hypothetical protein